MAMCKTGQLSWSKFRDQLMAEIAAWEKVPDPQHEFNYYACWLRALEVTLYQGQLTEPDTLEGRVTELLARPAGHDH